MMGTKVLRIAAPPQRWETRLKEDPTAVVEAEEAEAEHPAEGVRGEVVEGRPVARQQEDPEGAILEVEGPEGAVLEEGEPPEAAPAPVEGAAPTKAQALAPEAPPLEAVGKGLEEGAPLVAAERRDLTYFNRVRMVFQTELVKGLMNMNGSTSEELAIGTVGNSDVH